MICLQIRRAGGYLLYDPEVVVDHYPGPRPAGDHRTLNSWSAMSDEVHNETLTLMEFLPMWRRLLWLVWAVLCGTRRYPGLGVSLALLPRQRWCVLPMLWGSCCGRVAGVRTWRATRERG
jgi:hypothetical protein